MDAITTQHVELMAARGEECAELNYEKIAKFDVGTLPEDTHKFLHSCQSPTRTKDSLHYLHVYHSWAIEGIDLLHIETGSLTKNLIAIAAASSFKAEKGAQLAPIERACNWIEAAVQQKGELTVDVFRECHKKFMGDCYRAHDCEYTGGQFRMPSDEIYISGPRTLTRICPGDLINEELVSMLATVRTIHCPFIQAVYIHFGILHIHPFPDGNGRTARAIANVLLLRAGYLPLIIPKSAKDEYYSVLHEVRIKKALSPLSVYMLLLQGCVAATFAEHPPNHSELLFAEASKVLQGAGYEEKHGDITFWIQTGQSIGKDSDALPFVDTNFVKPISVFRKETDDHVEWVYLCNCNGKHIMMWRQVYVNIMGRSTHIPCCCLPFYASLPETVMNELEPYLAASHKLLAATNILLATGE